MFFLHGASLADRTFGATQVEFFRALMYRAMSTPRLSVLVAVFVLLSEAHADSLDPDLIFRKSTTFKFLTPNDNCKRV